jgi:hypothetical protein
LDGFSVQRSGFRWLVPDGSCCSAGQVVAYCNVGLVQKPGRAHDPVPFVEEIRDLQVALAPSHAGVLRIRSGLSLGGDLDQLHFYQQWDEGQIAAELETTSASDNCVTAPHWLLKGVAGRRVTGLAEDRSGILTGWHDRARAWHAETSGHVSVLSLGICEQNGIFRGELNGFAEFLTASAAPLHVIHSGDEALVPCSRTLVEQLARSDADNARIAEDMVRGLMDTGIAVQPCDLLFASCAIAALSRRPLADRFDLLTRNGVSASGVDAVVLSIHAEPGLLLRHKTLGYHAFWHRFRTFDAGPAVREWLQIAFEPVERQPDDKARDLLALRDVAASVGVEHMLIMNAMSSSGHEDIVSYQPFKGALADQIGTISAKETNLMLHDLAARTDICVVDADAIAGAIGGGAHLPDGVHGSRRMQSEVRKEILHILQQRQAFDRNSDDARIAA